MPDNEDALVSSALSRFLKYCRFDPVTGCVNWTGGTCSGQGKTARYGIFWFDGKPWRAHRWAAKYIHRQNIEGMQVDHACCNTLCVEHLQSVFPQVNRELQWIRVQVGLEEFDPGPEAEWVLSVPANFDEFWPTPKWLAENNALSL